MVLFRKSPIEPFEPPRKYADDQEIWVIEATGEIFASYDAYLRKFDYYSQKLFSCELTGHRHMTFFEALDSEKHGVREVDRHFPEPLRGPLLRKVQFSTISRTDELVNHLFETFKEDFYPGEQVFIDDPESGQRISGRIGEKQNFMPSSALASSNPQQTPSARYYVHVAGPPSREVLLNNKHIFRDRRSFTKLVLRSFLKHTIQRERFEGAPWMVKEDIARRYNIDTKVPPHLTADAILAQRKAAAAIKRNKGMTHTVDTGMSAEAEIKALSKRIREHKGKLPAELVLRFEEVLKTVQPKNAATVVAAAASLSSTTAFKKTPKLASIVESAKTKGRSSTPPTPKEALPILPKYPIEDLDVQPQPAAAPRPQLKHLNSEGSPYSTTASQPRERIDSTTVGSILEIWNTLNVHRKVFLLDSFTLDDFVDAMLFSSEEVHCELLNEIHCSVLKTLVNSKGEIEANIPSASSSEASSSPESSAQSTPEPEAPATRAKARSRQSNEAQPTPTSVKDSKTKDSSVNGNVNHRAEEIVEQFDWQERLKNRSFDRGGWQMIILGLLHHLSVIEEEPNPEYDKILTALAPTDEPATMGNLHRNYAGLDVNLRVSALELILMLTVTSKTFKESIDARSLQQTIDRKDKVDAQRRRKPLVEELQDLDTQRKLQRPDPVPETAEDSAIGVLEDISANVDSGREQANGTDESESEDELPTRSRSLRQTNSRADHLKRKREEEERKEKEKKAKLEEASLTAEEKAYRKILKDIEKKKEEIKECEDEIAEVDAKLRENACHRTRSLGQDRFCNRYWWFERSGMPFGGEEGSSTAHHGYANGRLWVQGPDDFELEGFFNPTEQESRKYRLEMGMTLQERREKEEGKGSSLSSSRTWGCIDSTEDLDKLIGWLDDRGNRERELRKELLIWRDKIAEYMDAMRAHLKEAEEKKASLDEPVIGIATRKKTYVDNNATKYPCLAWTNTTALQELGHLHSDGGQPKKTRGVARPTGKAAPPAKRETRRGTRF